ncbi:hypothetical protein EBT16_07500 [bacterium]|nr:hypothetical protein [bacterium]
MAWRIIFLGLAFFLFENSVALALPCCGLEAPRILASLQDLRQFDFSLTTSFEEVFAKYDSKGRVLSSEGPSDLVFQLTSLARITPDFEVFGRLPFIFRKTDPASLNGAQSNLGNPQLGLRHILYRNVYLESPLPSISVVTALKIPSGLSELTLGDGQASGWEPYLGLGVQKEFVTWMGNIDFGLARRQREYLFKAAESVSYAVLAPLSLGVGAQQVLSLNRSNRSLGVSSFANWPLDQFTIVGAQVDWSLPWEELGNQLPLTRTASLSLRYSFY